MGLGGGGAVYRPPHLVDKTPPREHSMLTSIPIRTISESNQREHWSRRHRRARAQRREIYLHLRATWCAPPQTPYTTFGPITITLIRIAPRQLDSGNLEASFKGIQDGVADWLGGGFGLGQDRQPGLSWRYSQRCGGTREYAVEIVVNA